VSLIVRCITKEFKKIDYLDKKISLLVFIALGHQCLLENRGLLNLSNELENRKQNGILQTSMSISLTFFTGAA
jgi:hypothetical protein